MRLTRIAGLAAAFALVATTAAPGMVSAHERPVGGTGGIPTYQHIFAYRSRKLEVSSRAPRPLHVAFVADTLLHIGSAAG